MAEPIRRRKNLAGLECIDRACTKEINPHESERNGSKRLELFESRYAKAVRYLKDRELSTVSHNFLMGESGILSN